MVFLRLTNSPFDFLQHSCCPPPPSACTISRLRCCFLYALLLLLAQCACFAGTGKNCCWRDAGTSSCCQGCAARCGCWHAASAPHGPPWPGLRRRWACQPPTHAYHPPVVWPHPFVVLMFSCCFCLALRWRSGGVGHPSSRAAPYLANAKPPGPTTRDCWCPPPIPIPSARSRRPKPRTGWG